MPLNNNFSFLLTLLSKGKRVQRGLAIFFDKKIYCFIIPAPKKGVVWLDADWKILFEEVGQQDS